MLGKNYSDASLQDINVGNANEAPNDTVSSIAWCPNTSYRYFATTSWDSKVRIYDTVIQNQKAALSLKVGFDVEDPCLSVTWCDNDMTKLFGGSVNGSVKIFDIQSGKSENIGLHDGSVKSVYWLPKASLAVSLSFDKTIRFWDLRQQQPAAALNLGLKVYCSDLLYPLLAVGMSSEKLLFLDLDNLQYLEKGGFALFDSTLKDSQQISCVSLLRDGSGFGIGSTDGRVNVSKFGIDQSGQLRPAPLVSFKTKNYEQSVPLNKQVLYPVHDIGFHHLNKGAIFTAGGEGALNFWDYLKKSRLTNYEFQGAPVTRAKLSPDGSLLAYATGYDWSLGIAFYKAYKTKVCVHVVQEADLVNKQAQTQQYQQQQQQYQQYY
jgi:mRNA export factor